MRNEKFIIKTPALVSDEPYYTTNSKYSPYYFDDSASLRSERGVAKRVLRINGFVFWLEIF